MDLKQKIILGILEADLFDSTISVNNSKLLNYVINKKRKISRLKRIVLSMFKNNKKHRKLKNKIVPRKSKDFLSLIERFSAEDFKRDFVMNRSTLQGIVDYLEPYWRAKTGRPSVSVKTALYITIWKLTRNCTFREMSNLFCVSKTGAFTYFIKIVNLLYAHRKKFIRWPKDVASKLQIMEKFQNLITNSIPHTLGCVDAIHIPILGLKEGRGNYIDKYGEYSMILQGICDSEQKFIDIYFGKPGSYNKATTWNSSPINDILKTSSNTIENVYILGDSEYPLKTYLITPYCGKESLTRKNKNFNYQHSSTRSCVEQAFKSLKSKFPILNNIEIRNTDYIKYIVIACVVLHNIIIDKEETNDVHCTIEEEIQSSSDSKNHISELAKAKNIRDRLAMQYSS